MTNEGDADYNAAGCAPKATMNSPLLAYNHAGRKCSVTSDYMYRGILYPAFSSKYFFAYYCSSQIGIMNADNSIV